MCKYNIGIHNSRCQRSLQFDRIAISEALSAKNQIHYSSTCVSPNEKQESWSWSRLEFLFENGWILH